MRLLIVRLSAMGDIVHALPLAENAHRYGATVGWLTEPAYRDLLEGNPHVDRLFLADTRCWRRRPFSAATRLAMSALSDALSEFRPDAAVDVQGLWKSALLARAARVPVVGFAASERKEPASAFLSDQRVSPDAVSAPHVVDRNLALLEALGIPVGRRAPDAGYLAGRPSEEARAFLAGVPRPFVVYHPGAGRPEKVWGEARLAEVARLLRERRGLHAAISWGPGDETRARRMEELLPGSQRIPRLDAHGLAHVARACVLFIAGDTGPLHLADALGVPTLALFGPTDPARNGPYRGTSVRYDPATREEEVAARALEVLDRRAVRRSP